MQHVWVIQPFISSVTDNTYCLCFALQAEAAEEFYDCDTLITGIGKVCASYALTKRFMSAGKDDPLTQARRKQCICKRRCGLLHKVCAAGYGCTWIRFQLYETPLSGIETTAELWNTDQQFTTGHLWCTGGIILKMSHTSTDYNVVDAMEAYPLALITMQEQIPFLCLKYISDGADGGAADDWKTWCIKRSCIPDVVYSECAVKKPSGYYSHYSLLYQSFVFK